MRQAPSDREHRTRTSQTLFEQVRGIVANVPEGKVTTYGAIALTFGLSFRGRLARDACARPLSISCPGIWRLLV